MTASAAPTSAPFRGVLADTLVKHRTLATDLALILTGVVLVAALAQVEVPLWPVPVTGQTLGVIIVGATLGARRGALSLLAYMGIGLAGAPIFASFTGGLAAVSKPSFGFVIGFVFAAFAIGWLAERNWDKKFWLAFAAFVGASVIPFLFGVPYMAVILGQLGLANDFGTVLALGVTPFIVGGIVKAGIAAAVIPLAWKGVRALEQRTK